MIGTLLNQRYLLESEIGRGGMGVVYRARDTILEREVAVKLVSTADLGTEGQARLLQEARAAASLNHPHIVAIHDAGETETGLEEGRAAYIVMELVDGPSLRSYRPASLDESLAVAWQICSALEAAHAKGIIHCDLKPENVLLAGRLASQPDPDRVAPPLVKLMDFGLARVSGAGRLAQEATLTGTLSYLAPELILGQPATPQSDLYAMGVMFYELIAGRPPFEGDSVAALLGKYLHAPAVPPSVYNEAVWPELDILVLRLLEKEPGRRPSSAGEVKEGLALLQAKAVRETEALLAASRSGAPGTAPAPSSLRRSNLPRPLTSFIGREEEIRQVERLLADARLVTITGTGGVGKTRLAIQVASPLVSKFRDGVWWIELAALAPATEQGRPPGEDTVIGAVAKALRVPETPGVPLLDALLEHLRDRQLLLVLDNCEHLVAACATLVQRLLGECPQLTVLATSREPLGVPGEKAWYLPSLSLPTAGASFEFGDIAQSEAVRLFVERTGDVLPGYKPAETDVPAIAQICRRLDGIPLAIELAAARMSLLSANEIAARLDSRFSLLTAGRRTALPRHQTLWAAIEWSYRLLGQAEQLLFRRLSVFAGSFTLEAAEAVCLSDTLERDETLTLLGWLVDKSLLYVDTASQQAELATRYRFYDTIGSFGRLKIDETDETGLMRDRHAAYYVDLVESIEPHQWRADQVYWINRLEAEHDNLIAALHWAWEGGLFELAGRLSGALAGFWSIRGYLSEGKRWLIAILDHRQELSVLTRARVLLARGSLAFEQGDYETAKQSLGESLLLWREVGDGPKTADLLNRLGHVAQHQGELASATELYKESLALYQELGDEGGIALALNRLGHLAHLQDDLTGATAYLEQSLMMRRRIGDRRGIASSLNALAEIARYRGEYARASRLYEESLELCQQLGDKRCIAGVCHNLGHVARHEGDLGRAAALFKKSLNLYRELENTAGVALCLAGLAAVMTASTQPEPAAQLFGASQRLLEVSGVSLSPTDRQAWVQNLALVRDKLGEAEFTASYARGQAMSLEAATAYALRE